MENTARKGRGGVHSVGDEYLEAIYTLHAEGEEAHGVTLAELFAVSRANAGATLGRLARDGLIAAEGRHIGLTVEGVIRAEAAVRRHRVTECFLVATLGMEWATVHAQARSFERGLSPLLEERLDARLGRPRACPHGNPIPRPDLDAAAYLRDRHAIRLAAVPVEHAVHILAISELVEDRAEWLGLCAAHGLLPGARCMVVGQHGPDGTLIATADHRVALPVPLAARIWIALEHPSSH